MERRASLNPIITFLSDFIGYLFLVFGDLYIDDELDKHSDLLDYHSIIRYMDDIYVSLTLRSRTAI